MSAQITNLSYDLGQALVGLVVKEDGRVPRASATATFTDLDSGTRGVVFAAVGLSDAEVSQIEDYLGVLTEWAENRTMELPIPSKYSREGR
ncbi:MAG TPA: hypothetical protein VF576_13625 [Rubricoccaceae bacterium]